MKYKTISRSEFERRRAAGETFTPAGLYEPDHAPKGTEFVLVQLAPGLTRFMRAR
jgi:hypothetical protein